MLHTAVNLQKYSKYKDLKGDENTLNRSSSLKTPLIIVLYG